MGKGRKFWCIALVISLLLCLFAGCEEETPTKKRRRTRDESEKVPEAFTTADLLGDWTVKTEKFEATLVFREEEDVFEATWRVYDFSKDVWREDTFQIKEVSGFTMVGLMPDGQIEYFAFAPYGQTLYFDGLYYSNPEKNVGLPEDTAKFAFLRGGYHTMVMQNVFLGMSYDEVKRAYAGVQELEAQQYGDFAYQATTYDVDADVPDHDSSWAYFRFDENKQLVQTYLHLYCSEYRASSYGTIKTCGQEWLEELTEKYGEYSMTERKYTDYEEQVHIYNIYRWEMGNIVCELKFDGIDTIDNLDSVTLTYTLKEYA